MLMLFFFVLKTQYMIRIMIKSYKYIKCSLESASFVFLPSWNPGSQLMVRYKIYKLKNHHPGM